LRTGAEIGAWRDASVEQRLRILAEIDRRRRQLGTAGFSFRLR
jgi:predicted Fe-S protein YdhL (DUF1289 family)